MKDRYLQLVIDRPLTFQITNLTIWQSTAQLNVVREVYVKTVEFWYDVRYDSATYICQMQQTLKNVIIASGKTLCARYRYQPVY